jgi:hypothetical protein
MLWPYPSVTPAWAVISCQNPSDRQRPLEMPDEAQTFFPSRWLHFNFARRTLIGRCLVKRPWGPLP